jgi:hypothetical protein
MSFFWNKIPFFFVIIHSLITFFKVSKTMNTRKTNRLPLFSLWITVLALLLSACRPVIASTESTPVQPAAAQPTETTPVIPATQPAADDSIAVTLDLSGVAQGQTIETIPAVPDDGNTFWTMVMPEYTRVTLQGYPVAEHQMQPQIFIYPVEELAEYNSSAGQMAADLQALLQSRQPGESLPYLPLINAKQMMHPQVQYLDFLNGSGVRYLTWFSQGIVMANNADLLYTYQGLTADGKFYLAVVLPITHPDLPASQQVYEQADASGQAYLAYLDETNTWLEQQPAGSFTPDLAALDALVQSIEVK